jgi:hypothetical protein
MAGKTAAGIGGKVREYVKGELGLDGQKDVKVEKCALRVDEDGLHGEAFISFFRDYAEDEAIASTTAAEEIEDPEAASVNKGKKGKRPYNKKAGTKTIQVDPTSIPSDKDLDRMRKALRTMDRKNELSDDMSLALASLGSKRMEKLPIDQKRQIADMYIAATKKQ